MFTQDEIRNLVIVRAREKYGQVEVANMAKGNMDLLNALVEALWNRLNSEIDLTVDDLEYDLTTSAKEDEEDD